MSHELRTPMTGVLGTMDLLSTTRLSAEQSQWLDIMRTSAQTLMKVLNDILDFSKIEADQIKVRIHRLSASAGRAGSRQAVRAVSLEQGRGA